MLPKILVIAAAGVNASLGLGFDLIITSGADGTHMVGSKHYTYEALDFRTYNIPPEMKELFIRYFRERLGPDYQLVDEGDHLHVEYDPQVV